MAKAFVLSMKSPEAILEPNPPLYYEILSLWMRCFGEGEFAVRFLSLICGVASIIITYKLGKLFGDNKIGLGGALLLAVSPMHIWFSQEARGYALLTFLLLAKIYFFLQVLIKNRKFSWISFSIFSVLSLYTHYFALIILLPEMAILLLFREHRHLFKRWIFCYTILFMCFLPWLSVFLKNLGGIVDSFWIAKPSLNSLFATFSNLTLGYNASKFIEPAVCLCLVLTIIGVCKHEEYNSMPLYFLIFLLAPILGIFLFSVFVAPIYLDRYFISLAPFYYLLIISGFTKFKSLYIKTGISFFIFLSLFCALINYFTDYLPSKEINSGIYTKKPFKKAAYYVKQNLLDEDLLVHTNPSTRYPFYYYLEDNNKNMENAGDPKDTKSSYLFFIPDLLNKFWYRLLTNSKLPWAINISEGIDCLKYKRIWLISANWDRSGLEQNSIEVRKSISRYHRLVSTKNIDGIYIDLYAK